MSRVVPFAGFFLALVAARAEAATAALPRSGSEPAFAARTDVGKQSTVLAYSSCPAAPCTTNDKSPRVEIEARFDGARATLDTLETPSGTHVIWARVPEAKGTHAFEVLLAPGHDEPLFAGITSAAASADTTTERLLRRDLGSGKTLVVQSVTPAGGGLCGLPEAPGPVRAWDGKKWASAALTRLDAAALKRAVPLAAIKATPAEARRYLTPVGGSDDTFGRAAVDGDARTAWLETRSGDGAGEYATYRLDRALSLQSISVHLAPTAAVPSYAAPRTFYVLLESAIYLVTPAPGDDLAIKLPGVAHSSCLSIVLADADGKVAAPRTVGVAEVGVRTALDAEPEASLIGKLGGAQADEALATLLARPGVPWRKVYPALSSDRRARVDAVVNERGCAESTQLAVLALSDPDKNQRERAAHKLEQCRRESAPALVATLDDPDAARAREAGRLLALLAPSIAQQELPPRLGQEPTRTAFWPALGKAFRSADAPALQAALAAAKSPEAKLDVVLALGDRAGEVPEARAVLTAAKGSAQLATRYRAVEPALRVQDASVAQDAEPAVRQRALSLMTDLPHVAAFDAPARAGLADPNPRVRAAAADYFRAHPAALSAAALTKPASDPWPFVRMASLRALGGASLGEKQSALPLLRERLEDKSYDVRKASLQAMAGLPAASVREDILARLDDEQEAVPVRAQAARTLGAVCSTADLDRLTLLAQATLTPMAFELEREVGLAAIEALGSIHPNDLEKRLGPLRTKKAPPSLKAAADRAFAAERRCR